ncbi:MAG: ATP-grasp domain-containing protein [Gaiellaceae bacterium]
MPAVLLTCVGRRVDIVRAFGAAGAATVAVDVNPLAPALYAAGRHALVPPVADEEYVPALAELVAAHDVDLVVPLADTDQLVLAERREELGALVLLPAPDVVERTNDKYLAHVFFEEHGIDSPPTWLPVDAPDDVEFPVLVKARFGFGSRNIFRAHDPEELAFFLRYSPVEPMVQRVCAGAEFSLDVFGDLEGRCLNTIPRTMIESAGGESIKGMTIRDPELVEVGRRVSETLAIVGPATVQCFRTASGRHEVTDVNLRFGGAFPLPLAAGSRYPELALALASGERPEPRLGEYREGVVITRWLGETTLVRDGEGFAPLGDATVGPAEDLALAPTESERLTDPERRADAERHPDAGRDPDAGRRTLLPE